MKMTDNSILYLPKVLESRWVHRLICAKVITEDEKIVYRARGEVDHKFIEPIEFDEEMQEKLKIKTLDDFITVIFTFELGFIRWDYCMIPLEPFDRVHIVKELKND